MGITGLWKIVEPTGTEIPLECLEGKKLAIDVSIWIYQAQTAYPADQPYPHLRLLVSRLAKLLFYKIRPVFVFDGPQVPHLKRRVLEMRRTRKLEEDDILKNTQKMKSLKEIASGQLQGAALESTIQKVISPSKRLLRKREEDVYKDIGATSSNLELEERIHFDRMNYSGDSEGEEDGEGGEAEDQDSDVEILMEPVEKVEVEEKEKEEEIPEKPVRNQTPSATRREEIQNLLDKREFIRNSRLRPEMIPADSKTFSNFQMQRLLQRGRLNEQIEKLAKSSNTTGFLTSDKINVTGPDGTRHVLQHAYQDEIQHLQPEIQGNREIDSLYRKQPIEMTLDIFNVEYGGKKYSREGTPDDVLEEGLEKKFSSAGSNYREYQSKSGMLEAIARKRIRQHYGTGEVEKRRKRHQEEEEEVIGDVSDDEMAFQAVLLESASKNLEDKMKLPPSPIPGTSKDSEEVEWDPQRYDPQPSTSSDFRNLMNKSRDNNDETTKTPELYRDLQEFLTNCGIPWIEAPGEAEAQCVELEKLKLVDGVVTDDSDVWAFGVRHVYRHMFSKNRRVQRYGETTAANRDNLRKFCLQREDYISIALLSGGDYCPGLIKIGAIGALELVAEFIDEKRDEQQYGSVEQIENRIMQLLEKARNLFLSAPDEAREASRNAMKLRRHVNEANEKENIEMVCSNRDAVHAYLEPLVDTSSEKFRWRQMNIPLVRQILHQRLNWPDKSQIHEENNSFAAFEKWNSFLELGGHSQRRLDGFFSAKLLDKPLEFVFTKKMVEALEKIQRKRTGVTVPVATDSDIVVEKVKPSPKKRSKTIASGRGRGRGRGRRGNTRGGGKSKPQKDLNLSEESSSSYSDDSFDDV